MKIIQQVTFILLACGILSAAQGEIEFGPYLQFVSPERAVLVWKTSEPTEGIVTLKHNGGSDTQTIQSPAQRMHQVVLSGLQPKAVYTYQVEVKRGEESFQTEEFALEQKMNYTLPKLKGTLNTYTLTQHTVTDQADPTPVQDILYDADIFKGMAVVYGAQYYPSAFDLARQSDLSVILLDHDMDRVQTARDILSGVGAYGTRVNVRWVDDFAHLNITPNFANLIIAPDELNEEEIKALLDILRPSGGTAYIQPLSDLFTLELITTRQFYIRKVELGGQTLTQIVKKPVPGAGAWTHQYGNPANNANGGEMLSGVSKTTDLSVQWVGKPGADFGIDRNPRMPAPLAVSGRIFHQGMNRMVALDAYNGSILWSLEIPDLRRVNLPHDCSNWCADEDYLYTAIKHQMWKINQKDGSITTHFELPVGYNGGKHDWGFIAKVDDTVFGSTVKKGTVYTEFFGHDTWYDQQEGEGAEKVCGEAIFAVDHQDGEMRWIYQNGAIIHSTVTLADGHVFFVESRNPKIKDLEIARVGDDLLWSDQFLVSLDANTGEKAWEQAIDTVDGKAIFFMIHGEGKLILVPSADGHYHLYAYNAANGKELWQQSHEWTDGDHSGHMQHPLIVAGGVFLEPCGYDLSSGKLITENMGRREGCSTYTAVANALIYRGEDRRISMWDRHTEAVSSWVNLRPSCWLSVIPAGGMVLAPEGGGGCSCGNWIETSLGFMPIAALSSNRN